MRYLACISGILLSACVSHPSAPSVQIQENDAIRQAIKTGYHAQSLDGEKRYCRERTIVGSHFTETACFTPDQLVRLMDVQNQVQDALNVPERCSGGFMCNGSQPGKSGK